MENREKDNKMGDQNTSSKPTGSRSDVSRSLDQNKKRPGSMSEGGRNSDTNSISNQGDGRSTGYDSDSNRDSSRDFQSSDRNRENDRSRSQQPSTYKNDLNEH